MFSTSGLGLDLSVLILKCPSCHQHLMTMHYHFKRFEPYSELTLSNFGSRPVRPSHLGKEAVP